MAKVTATSKGKRMGGLPAKEFRAAKAGTTKGGRNVLSGRTKSQTAKVYGAALRGTGSRRAAESAALSTGAGGGNG